MRWPLPILLVLALAACGDNDEGRTPSLAAVTDSPVEASSTATPSLSPTQVPTPTPLPGCQPLSPDGGFPVMIGGIAGQPCVIWRGTSPARVFVEEGAFAAESPPTNVVLFDQVSSPFIFPPGVLPGIRPDRGCFDRDGGFRVRVETTGGAAIGAEERFTCSHIITLADGCRVGLSGRDGPFGLGKIEGAGAGEPAACIVWPDRYTNETGFRITLSYPNSGEEFVYLAPPNTVEFIPPEGDTRGVGSFATGLGRKDWAVTVIAITPNGEVFVDSQAVTVM